MSVPSLIYKIRLYYETDFHLKALYTVLNYRKTYLFTAKF